jgi:hypothetical protein
VVEHGRLVEINLEHLAMVVAIKALTVLSGVGEFRFEPIPEETIDFILTSRTTLV